MMRTIVRGALAGLLVTLMLAVWDGVSARGHLFGLRTGLVGVAAGGLTLGLAFCMALASYYLARRNRLPALRKRLLVAAIFAGPAGMAMGFASAGLWMAAGRPWFG